MSYIHFDKTQLINLNYSLEKENNSILNRSGCYNEYNDYRLQYQEIPWPAGGSTTSD